MAKHKKFRVFANDGRSFISMDVVVYSDDLTPTEAKKQMNSAKRAIAKALEQIAFTDFGIENTHIKNAR